MNTRTKANASVLAVIAAVCVAVMFAASTAHASPTPEQQPVATATLTAEDPSVTNPTTAGGITLAGTLDGASEDYFADTLVGDQLGVLNPGGTSGWKLTAWLDPFVCQSTGCGCASPPCTSATSGADKFTDFEITKDGAAWNATTAPTATCTSGACVAPAGTAGWGSTISNTSGSPTTIYDDTAGNGIGGFTFVTNWWIGVPDTAREGTYTSTVTLDIAKGP